MHRDKGPIYQVWIIRGHQVCFYFLEQRCHSIDLLLGRERIIYAKKEENMDFDVDYLIHHAMPVSERVQCAVAYKSAMKCPQLDRIRALFPGHSWNQGVTSQALQVSPTACVFWAILFMDNLNIGPPNNKNLPRIW